MTNETTSTSIAATAIRLGDGTEIDIDQYGELLTTEICKQIGAALQADFMGQLSKFEDNIARLVTSNPSIQMGINTQTAQLVVGKLEDAGDGKGHLINLIAERVIEKILDNGAGDPATTRVADRARRLIVAADLKADGALASAIAGAMFAREAGVANIFASAIKQQRDLQFSISREIWDLAKDQIIEQLKNDLTKHIDHKLSGLMTDIRDAASTYRRAANVYKHQRDALKSEYEEAAINMRNVHQKLTDLRRDLDALAETMAPIECPELFPAPAQPDRG